MINKRILKMLEGILVLITINTTKSKRQTAYNLGISVDTVSSYIMFLENEIGHCLIMNQQHHSEATPKGKYIISQFKNIFSANIGDKNINFSNLKILKSMFYLKALSEFKNKRNTMQNLSASIETINLHIDKLEEVFNTSLATSNNNGSVITPFGNLILQEFDKLLDALQCVLKKCVMNTKIRLALSSRINFSPASIWQFSLHNVVIFNNDPCLHPNDWDIAITYAKPIIKDIKILFQRKVNCGFFASSEYLQHHGKPKDLNDIKQNHFVLTSDYVPFADETYKRIINGCKNIHHLHSAHVLISDAARFGGGICIIPVTSKLENLVHLDYLQCDIESYIYLTAHKNCSSIPYYRDAVETYKRLIMQI